MSRPSSARASRPATALKHKLKRLEELSFSDTFTHELPADALTPIKKGPNDSPTPETDASLRKPRPVRSACFTFIRPEPYADPIYVTNSPPACYLIDLDPAEYRRREFALYLTGSRLFCNSRPWAHNYGGHQFGIYAGQLGDGRCVSLGEIVNSVGERWELQLKGSGLTPYSRFGDGCAVVRSCIREFLCSEYMAAIGVPTTRALAIIGTRMPVYREEVEAGAIVSRLAPSWVRFGSFELFHYRNEKERVKELADYVMKHHFPEVLEPAGGKDGIGAAYVTVMGYAHAQSDGNTRSNRKSENKRIEFELNKYARFFQQVVKRTAELVAHWQAVGFVHGVLNTDNMSILGLTLDYGPFGFLDVYDPFWTSNAADSQERYRFEHQPKMALWNLSKLGRTLAEFTILADPGKELPSDYDVKGEEVVRELLKVFEPLFIEKYTELMGKKLGLPTPTPTDLQNLIDPLLQLLADTQTDYTLFFRALCNFRTSETGFAQCISYDPENPPTKRLGDCLSLLLSSVERLGGLASGDEAEERTPAASVDNLQASMSGAYGTVTEKVTKAPNEHRLAPISGSTQSLPPYPTATEVATRWQEWASAYRERLLSSSSSANNATPDLLDIQRTTMMRKTNPLYALRTHITESVIQLVRKELDALGQSLPPLPSQHGLASRQRQGDMAQTGFKDLDRVMRVLINDVWGDMAESVDGWKDEDDRNAAEIWAGEVPEWAQNLVQTTMS